MRDCGWYAIIPPMENKQGPVKKHWKWTRRIYCAIGVFLLVTLAARLWWGSYANDKLQGMLDDVAARGEPIEWSDLKGQPVSDEENAAILYRKATDMPLLKAVDSTDDLRWRRRRQPLPPNNDHLYRLQTMLNPLVESADFRRKYASEMKEILKLSVAALAVCREAGELDRCDWGMDFDQPALSSDLPDLLPMKELARLLCLAAIDAHGTGNDAQAIEYLQDARGIARHLRSAPNVLGYLVVTSVDSISMDAFEEILPGLAIGDQPNQVSRKDAENLVQALLDTSSLTNNLTYAFITERCMAHDTFTRFRADLINNEDLRFGSRTLYWVFDPVLKLDETWPLLLNKAYIEGSKQATRREMIRECRGVFSVNDYFEEINSYPLKRYSRPLSSILMPSFGRLFTMHCEAIAKQRMVGMALAIRLYELDNSSRPNKLGNLVPKYLPAVPADPFGRPGDNILYSSGAKQPVLYSVGRDGKDDSGKYSQAKDEGDVLFFLAGGRPESDSHWEEPAKREKPESSRHRGRRDLSQFRRGSPTSQPTSRPRRARRRL